MMKRVQGGWALALALVVSFSQTLAAQEVEVSYDKTVDFSTYTKFAIEVGTAWGNPIAEKQALGELTAALEAKGWKAVPAGEAQAVVLLHGATERRRSLETFYSGGSYRWRGGFGTATTTIEEYTVGTLVVDIFDAKSKELLWRGVAQGELKEKQEKREKQLAKATGKLLQDFPPGSKGS